jgi:SOS response regulatory protein OraA/RecX
VRVVTALRERPRDRVEVELDGVPWRLVPAEAVVRTGLSVGRALDREAARTLGRELRRAEALGVAMRALRYRDQSRRRLEERLSRRGMRTEAQEDALAALEQAGLVDDGRVASARADALAARGYGDAAIRFKLEGEGLAAELVAEALAGLDPEAVRAGKLLDRRGHGPASVRWLASRGFDAGTLEDLAGFADEAWPR